MNEPELIPKACGAAPTIEHCLWLAETYCQPESWGNEFLRGPLAILAQEVRRLRGIERGEYICKHCGLRKDAEFERGDF